MGDVVAGGVMGGEVIWYLGGGVGRGGIMVIGSERGQ